MPVVSLSESVVVRAAADLHGFLPVVEPCEVLLLAGDLVPYELEADYGKARRWLLTEFSDWLEHVPAQEVFACAGNHDFVLTGLGAGVHERAFGLRWTYVEDAETLTRDGLRIYATPWTEGHPDAWAFQKDAFTLGTKFRAMPKRTDILLTHGPPEGHGDYVPVPDEISGLGTDGYHAGSRELLQAIRERQPQLVVFGHIHNHGGYQAQEGKAQLANVSILGPDDQIAREPATFTLEPGRQLQ